MTNWIYMYSYSRWPMISFNIWNIYKFYKNENLKFGLEELKIVKVIKDNIHQTPILHIFCLQRLISGPLVKSYRRSNKFQSWNDFNTIFAQKRQVKKLWLSLIWTKNNDMWLKENKEGCNVHQQIILHLFYAICLLLFNFV